MENKIQTSIKNIEKEIKKIKDKKYKFLFFVVDSKNVPSGSLANIYETAMILKNLGYTVQMLHSEKEFQGVKEWLGEEYAKLPHFYIEDDKQSVSVSPSDILIIPDVYASLMAKTKELPCKRVLLLQNMNYLTESMPMGASIYDMRIRECITIDENLAEKFKKIFPSINVEVVSPSIPEYFIDNSDEPKKLIINIVSKSPTDTNSIIKQFFWKYPMLKWVAFRDLKNMKRQDYAEILKEGFATIWVDPLTNFGHSIIEAMASKNIVIGKIPEHVSSIIANSKGDLTDCGIWALNNEDISEVIANVVDSFLTDNIPTEIYDNMKKMVDKYSIKNQEEEVKKVYIDGIAKRNLETLENALTIMKNNKEKNEK